MIKVFIWDYKNLDMVGHASLEVKGHYISWWPNTETGVPDKTINHLPIGLRNKFNLDESIFSAMPIFKRTFNDDKKSEKRGPDRVIIIKGLDEKSIILWWKTFGIIGKMQGPPQSWDTLQMNCSTVVATALKHGGGDKYSHVFSSKKIVWTPNNVWRYANSIKYNLK